MKPASAFSLLFCAGLAAGIGAGAALRADAQDAPAAVSAPASVSGTAAPVSGTAAGVFPGYAALLAGTIQSLDAPLAVLLGASGRPGISVAAGGFRELVTGERSPFCDHLDKDLSDHLRTDTPYGVPSTLELADAWVSVGGAAADMGQPYTLRRFGRILDLQAVVSGDYRVKGSEVVVRVRLLRCSDGKSLWDAVERLPVSALASSDLEHYAGSAPPGYGASLSAPAPPRVVPAGATLTAGSPAPASADEAYLSGVRLVSDVRETEFSIYRLNFGAGYEFDDPTNPVFRAVAHGISAPYVDLNWADVARVEFYLWDLSSVSSYQYAISSLFGYGMTAELTLPVRLGHYWVVYGGVGGRFETINVNSALIPSQDTVSFGNNSVFVTLGAKAHIHSVGVDADASYGPNNLADQTGYFTARLGLYYEYNFE